MRLAAVALLVVLAAGCGGEDEAGSRSGSAPATSLEISVDDDGAGGESWSLTCDPEGGTHPDPEAACRALAGERDALQPVPGDRACTEIWGGPQTATVSGTLADEPYRGRFSRANGCEIDRWDRLRPLLVVRGGA